MDDNVLKILKDEYEKNKAHKNYMEDLLTRVSVLEKNELVQEYIRLIQTINSQKNKDSSYEDTIYGCFKKNISLIKDVDNIYVCLGTFIYSDDYGYDLKVDNDDFKAEYRIYRNLENGSDIKVFMDSCYEFESCNTVIFLNAFSYKGFFDIQKEYISNLVVYGKEEAYKRVLKKNK